MLAITAYAGYTGRFVVGRGRGQTGVDFIPMIIK